MARQQCTSAANTTSEVVFLLFSLSRRPPPAWRSEILRVSHYKVEILLDMRLPKSLKCASKPLVFFFLEYFWLCAEAMLFNAAVQTVSSIQALVTE